MLMHGRTLIKVENVLWEQISEIDLNHYHGPGVTPWAVFTTLLFLRNFGMGPVRLSVGSH